MAEIILEAQIRENKGKGKVKAIRDDGFTPAVIYGEGKESFAIQVSSRELIQLVHRHRLENAIINLKIKDDKKAKSRACLVKEIQHDPVHGNIVHVDFNEISLTKEIKINVPVVAKGEAVGVKQEGGSLEFVMWEIEVECLPTAIPAEIEVDVTNLKMGDAIHIKDIKLPAGVKPLSDPDSTVVHVVAPMKEEVPVEEGLEGEAAKEPEVIKEKKEVPGEEGAKEGKEAKETKEKK